jgi:hypothetical protein
MIEFNNKIRINFFTNNIKFNYLIFFMFFVLVFVFWKSGFYFFWRDDWTYLIILDKKPLSLFYGEFQLDTKPLFPYVFLIEKTLFGINAIFYHWVNLFLFAILSFTVYLLTDILFKNKALSLITGLFFLVHPSNFITIEWAFASCEIIHLIFQLLSLYYLIKYIYKHKIKHLLFSVIFLITQNLFFPNGIFLPFIAIILAIIYKAKRIKQIILISSLSFLILFIIQYVINIRYSIEIHNILNFSVIGQIINYYYLFIATSISRLFYMPTHFESSIVYQIIPLLYLCILVYAIYKFKKIRKEIFILLLWLFLSSITIPIVRYGLTDVNYYYTSLLIIPLLMILIVILNEYYIYYIRNRYIKLSKKNRRAIITLMGCLIFIFLSLNFVINQHAISIFETRNFFNESQMQKAIKNHSDYVPYDDPCVSMDLLKYNDSLSSGGITKQCFLKLKSETPYIYK